MKTIVDVFRNSVNKFGDRQSFLQIHGRRFHGLSFNQLQHQAESLAKAMMLNRLQHQENVVLLCDSGVEWIVSDLAILHCGAVVVPRGTDTTPMEMEIIIRHSEAVGIILSDEEQLKKFIDKRNLLNQMKFVIVLKGTFSSPLKKINSLDLMIHKGEKSGIDGKALLEERIAAIHQDCIAAITYTSGATGVPKGVITTHKNFVWQIKHIPDSLELNENDRYLSLLPAWHIFGTVVDYYMTMSRGATVYFSNKRDLAKDLITVRPTIIASVPRVWEGIYNRIMIQVHKMGIFRRLLFKWTMPLMDQYLYNRNILLSMDRVFNKPSAWSNVWQKSLAALRLTYLFPQQLIAKQQFRKIKEATGGKLRVAVSGGSTMPRSLDKFFALLDIPICEGYGLTESTSVVAHRYPKNNFTKRSTLIPGTVGPMVEGCQIKIIDLKKNQDVTLSGGVGTIFLRGPMIMQGYWKNPDSTSQVLSEDGWLNSGDLGRMTHNGCLSIVGREKDTIVLSNGENVEPSIIEEMLCTSPLIDRAVLVGQDRKSLAALIVPNQEELLIWAKTTTDLEDNSKKIQHDYQKLLDEPKTLTHFRKIINRLISYERGFKDYEKVNHFIILADAFQPGEELTPTLKLKRHFVTEKYKKEIEIAYQQLH